MQKMVKKRAGKGNCITLNEEDKRKLEEIKQRRMQSDAKAEVIAIQLQNLMKRIEETNRKMSLLL